MSHAMRDTLCALGHMYEDSWRDWPESPSAPPAPAAYLPPHASRRAPSHPASPAWITGVAAGADPPRAARPSLRAVPPA
ncbi:hypothetical protein GCM10018793_24450 [Streptomyces sulfonofaciens]|uniref:Uncharacterized protein n=1 Tax=Streptomyces sulfonofaciens TaxID=68272 RepID=A0A919G431_9ACTN|nr:hypothetical protein GCM10018793_24450 [Streptomyces sulfonofaciens]